ncbi:MAG: Ni/Fe hydrogenase subunit alpha [Methanobacteriaceae archaeon]|nr:Ni/Fe hydrogenase subunit alpha [Methanobacteriaceae archaeon]
MVELTLEPVTRIEGHAKITVDLDEEGNVKDTKLHVMEFRGFEKFLQGRPIEEVPRIVPRICGICDVQHHLAAAKACDQIFGYKDDEILPTAYKMREIMNWGSYMHSHTLSFYFLSAPDFIGGSDRKTRNVFQVIKDYPELATKALELRRLSQGIVAAMGGRPIHQVSNTPGGITTSLTDEEQAEQLKNAKRALELSVDTIEAAKPIFEENIDLVKTLGNVETYHCGLVNDGVWDVYNGNVRMKDKSGKTYAEFESKDYLDYMAEGVKPYSWLKFPYIKDLGYPEGIYRVAPLSRINVCDKMPSEKAQDYLKEFRDNFGYAQEPLLFHWARLIELVASAEMAVDGLEQDLSGQKFPEPLEKTAGKGVGIVEAARGTLTHHYETDEKGLVTKANIIVATVQNNPSMEMGIQKVAKDYIKPGVEVDDKIFNLMEMVIRAYDPCLSCATHQLDTQMRLSTIEVYDHEGNLVSKV